MICADGTKSSPGSGDFLIARNSRCSRRRPDLRSCRGHVLPRALIRPPSARAYPPIKAATFGAIILKSYRGKPADDSPGKIFRAFL